MLRDASTASCYSPERLSDKQSPSGLSRPGVSGEIFSRQENKASPGTDPWTRAEPSDLLTEVDGPYRIKLQVRIIKIFSPIRFALRNLQPSTSRLLYHGVSLQAEPAPRSHCLPLGERSCMQPGDALCDSPVRNEAKRALQLTHTRVPERMSSWLSRKRRCKDTPGEGKGGWRIKRTGTKPGHFTWGNCKQQPSPAASSTARYGRITIPSDERAVSFASRRSNLAIAKPFSSFRQRVKFVYEYHQGDS
ncbi:hypothetical protein RRG08_044405 [Elysia crispata]|uniref:Uncharacterized protein n=1 Tax=Elysia crispata TaxID=231223 RepID=A0AAE0ZW74_9GAST|nr:hypothetical protein RRG08_044405 [Elysia crispata]